MDMASIYLYRKKKKKKKKAVIISTKSEQLVGSTKTPKSLEEQRFNELEAIICFIKSVQLQMSLPTFYPISLATTLNSRVDAGRNRKQDFYCITSI